MMACRIASNTWTSLLPFRNQDYIPPASICASKMLSINWRITGMTPWGHWAQIWNGLIFRESFKSWPFLLAHCICRLLWCYHIFKSRREKEKTGLAGTEGGWGEANNWITYIQRPPIENWRKNPYQLLATYWDLEGLSRAETDSPDKIPHSWIFKSMHFSKDSIHVWHLSNQLVTTRKSTSTATSWHAVTLI
jgi:hypothetical protein